LDVAEISGRPVELAAEGLTTGHHPFSTMCAPDALAHFLTASQDHTRPPAYDGENLACPNPAPWG
jgi:hypothetical protein